MLGVAAACCALASPAHADRPDRASPPPPPVTHGNAQPPASPCPQGYVRIPPGTFTMGSPDGEGLPQEHPQRKVTLPGFCMQKTEVTVSEYAECVAAHACTPAATMPSFPGIQGGLPPADRLVRKDTCNAGHAQERANHPINCIDWDQADGFCRWAGGSLPTEEQWEYAARGTDGRLFPWGNQPPSAKLLNACGPECSPTYRGRFGTDQLWPPAYADDDGFPETAPVGSFPAGASPFGVLDMAGNVGEWTASPFCPNGTCSQLHRIIRGSAFSTGSITPSLIRAARRKEFLTPTRSFDMGFRCAK